MPKRLSLKFLIHERDHARLLRHPLLRDTGPSRQEQVVSIHYDTRTLQLQARAIELTLRRHSSSWLQSVEQRESATASEVSANQWSVPYFNHFDFSAIEDAKLRDWLGQAKIIARIAPIFESTIRRTSWRVSVASGVTIDASFGRGTLVSSGRRELVADFELALVEGLGADLYAFAMQLAARVPLTPQLLTIGERGCRLFLNKSATPAKGDSFTFPSNALPLQIFQQIALSCLHHMQGNQLGAATSSNPEYIHQMRVATRRLRAAIQIFKPLIPPPVVEQMTGPLRDLMQTLGRVRDLDVVAGEIVDPVTNEMPDEPSVVALSAALTERRYQARGEVSQLLQTPEFGHLQLRTEALLDGLSLDTSSRESSNQVQVSDEHGMSRLKLAEFAQRRLRSRLKRLHESASRARVDDPASLHRTRICIKRLRYALEFFSPMMQKKASAKTLKTLAGAQEKLGQLNDIAVAGDVLLLCISADRNLRLAVSLVASWHAQRYADLLADVALDVKQIEHLKLPRLA